MIEIRLDGWLREFGPRRSEAVDAHSVDSVVDALETGYPRMRFKLRDETGRSRRYVRVFVDGEDVRGTTGLGTKLTADQAVDILHSVAGG